MKKTKCPDTKTRQEAAEALARTLTLEEELQVTDKIRADIERSRKTGEPMPDTAGLERHLYERAKLACEKSGKPLPESLLTAKEGAPDWKRVRELGREEGRRLWRERGKWGRGGKRYMDFFKASRGVLAAISREPMDLQDLAGLVVRFAGRLSTVPAELAEATRETAAHLNALAEACSLYSFEVQVGLEAEMKAWQKRGEA